MLVGVVIIGRNEGDRLKVCLDSVQGNAVVYVDSESTDDSVIVAEKAAAHVVKLDMSKPFSAARARNEGLKALIDQYPQLEYVQFVDGDCEVVEGWLESSIAFLESSPGYGVVCGRRQERFPDQTIYNLLCDIEWDTPIGDALACGGDALMRVAALTQVGGYDPSFIAGEEPELCFRLRENGWKIARIDEQMTRHDAAIYHLKQWWKRSLRSGYAYTLNNLKHGHKAPEYFKSKELKSIKVWFCVLSFLFVINILCLSPYILLASLGLLMLQIVRVGAKDQRTIRSKGVVSAMLYSAFNLLAKIPQFLGHIRCLKKHRRGVSHTIVEYK